MIVLMCYGFGTLLLGLLVSFIVEGCEEQQPNP